MTQTDSKIKALIVDDDDHIRFFIAEVLRPFNLHLGQASSLDRAVKMMAQVPFDIVFLDVILPDGNGLDILENIMKSRPETVVITMTGFPSVEDSTKSFKLGALDYLLKPIAYKTLNDIAQKALEAVECCRLKESGATDTRRRRNVPERIVYQSQVMKEVIEKTRSAATTDSTVLITGESGTGKELIARMLHNLSDRADNGFVPVDCSALVETLLESELFGHTCGAFTGAQTDKAGLFELANKGTFFFDEISNLSYKIQCKLLRVIQEREFRKVGSQVRQKLDIRILCASNLDLLKAVERGTFRNDLYYRINVVPIHLPPLRERVEDIPLLLDYFLDYYSQIYKSEIQGYSDDALELLQSYPWPGNVRELRHIVEQILVLEKCDFIRSKHLPVSISRRRGAFGFSYSNGSGHPSLEEMEKKYIQFILNKTGGIRQHAADILQINRKTLSVKIKKFELDAAGDDA